MTAKLDHLDVLILDCQATGANPAKGHLLEIGWAPFRAADPGPPESFCPETYLVQLPPEIDIPRRVRRITGISGDDLEGALPPRKIWKKLSRAARDVGANNPDNACPTVIHFAGFEEPFLRELHRQYSPRKPFPFQIICTHRIVKRLFPHLPRKGLRAAAGYLGLSVAESRRCRDHLAATAFIWKRIVQTLKEEHGIHTQKELRQWQEQSPAPSTGPRVYPMERQVRQDLPAQPGVYRMLRANGDILYVGKARSLKQRVNSYFRPNARHGEHILEMLTQARDLKITVTGSALEAALLEADEIKRLNPPYNVALRQNREHLFFYSADMNEVGHTPDRHFCLGPLPSEESLKPFAHIKSLLEGEENPESLSLGMLPEYAPPGDCFRQGFELFRQRYQQELAAAPLLVTLKALGSRFWAEKLDREEPEEEEEAEEEELEVEQTWTPEGAAHLIEAIIRQGTFLLRRARWLCRLSESCLAWEPRQGAGEHQILLIIEGGQIQKREHIPASSPPPLPPGYQKKIPQRQHHLDPAAYDRLRVLTTELRRLTNEARPLHLRLGPTPLTPTPLSKMLKWL
jgi:DNA polymerase-3 subunit epsilon